MPTRPRRETTFISLFLSAYENSAWKNAALEWLDQQFDGAIEVRATRPSDGKTLAIEHTIIEPFIDEKHDLAQFAGAFLKIEDDQSLPVAGFRIEVFVPVGIFRNQHKKDAPKAIVQAVHNWIKENRLNLPTGRSTHAVEVYFDSGKPTFQIELTVKVTPLHHGPTAAPGIFKVRRQQVENNLGEVIAKALSRKLPKLVNTVADKRILMLERQHMNLYPKDILDEIKRRRLTIPSLVHVQEIWILENVFGETEAGQGYTRFEHYRDDGVVDSLDFEGPRLWMRSVNGMGEVI